MIDAAFSLPPAGKSVESTIRLPCDIDARGARVIARPDTIFRPHFLAVHAAAQAMFAGGTPIGGAVVPSLVTNTIGASITTAPAAVGFPLIFSQMGLRMSLP